MPVLSRSMAEDQTPTGTDDGVRLPLFERAISRRHMLLGSAALGAVLAAPALACGGSGDKSTFASGSQSSTTGAPSSTTPGASSTESASSGPAIPANGAVTVDFTYAFSGGMAKNPYIAVWVQTAAGKFVDTISLWYQKGRGDRYLTDMRSWISASGGRDTSMSSATRTAGSYSVVWDGNDASGARAPQGDYVVYIECAREKGPYSVISVPITCGTAAAKATGGDKGEISKVSVAYAP